MPSPQQVPVISPTYVSANVVQNRFDAGIDTISADTQIAENGYEWIINGRPRYGYVEPIGKHTEDLNLPAGIRQGILGVGNVLLAFVSGQAYAKAEGEAAWSQVAGFIMDPTVSQYYFAAVPVSSFNYFRTPPDLYSPRSTLGATQNNFKINQTPAGIVVQDTINQPWLIYYNAGVFQARRLQTYDEWSNLDVGWKEYVPRGKQMLYLDSGILLIVAPDGKSVFRSITGRPLDFMINVDMTGAKLANESIGGALTVSFAMDYDEVTCLASINTPDSFIYATAHSIKVVSLDYTNTLFGEPTFIRQAVIGAGIVNQYSFVELLGGYAFINYNSITTFDAVQQLKFQGKNSIFSKEVSKLIRDRKQTNCSAIVWNNYALFNVDSVWGNIVLVYDLLLSAWVSFDITEATKIKHFAITESLTETCLYAITESNKLYKMYSSPTSTYLTQIKTRAFAASETSREHKAQHLRTFFRGGTSDGYVRLIEYVDDQLSGVPLEKTLNESIAGVMFPVRPPVIPGDKSRTDSPTFTLTNGLSGKKIAYILQWNTDARLIEFELTVSSRKAFVSQKEQNQVINNTYGANS